MKYSAVIYDVDGTLADASQGLLDTYKHTLPALGIAVPADDVLKTFIGPTPKTIFMNYFHMSDVQAHDAMNLFRSRHKQEDLYKAFVYDGVYDVLEKLKQAGVKQAIATMKRQDYATLFCKHFKFDDYCNPIYGSDANNVLKKADLIKYCLRDMGVSDLSTAVMVGDTAGDRDAAAAVGIDFVGVSYGFGLKDDCKSKIIDDIRQLAD